MPSLIEPGMRVRHPDRPDWGEGQVQSVIGDRITVNFENAGKLLINAALVELEIVEHPALSADQPAGQPRAGLRHARGLAAAWGLRTK